MRTSFLFDPEQESPESLARRRELAEAILQRSAGSAPSNIGEGLSAIGQALGARIALNRVGKAEAAGRSKALESFNNIFGGGGRTVDAVKSGSGSYEVPMPAGGDVIRAGLIKRGLPEHVADAFVLNFKDESNLNPGINEAKPIVPGSRGGFGLSQWTGDRRRNLEAFAGQRGVPVSDLDMQLDFLMTELQGPENDAFKAIMAEGDTGGAAAAIVNKFLRPAEQHRASREARYRRYGGVPAGMIDARPAPVNTGINPADYMDTRPAQPTGADPASFRQPVQLASADPNFNYAPQAPIQPRQRVADAMMSNAQPAARPMQMAQAQGFDPRILEALSNPYLPEGHKRVLGAMLEQQMKQMYPDPAAALEMEYKRAQMGDIGSDNARADRELELQQQKFALEREGAMLDMELKRNPQMSPYEREQIAIRKQELEAEAAKLVEMSPGTTMFDPKTRKPIFTAPEKDDRPWWVRADGSVDPAQIENQRAGKPETTISMGETDKFYENLDKKNAETFSALSEAGVQARAKLAQVDRLEGLLATAPQGAAAMLKQFAGEYGIPTDGLSDIQAAQALINELVPQQRQPGSGPMSDADLALFKQSLPRLINQPGGNQIIIDTMRGITQYQIQMGEIADLVADRDISPAEGRKRIRALANPLDGLGKKVTGPAPSAPKAPAVPQPEKLPDDLEELLKQYGD